MPATRLNTEDAPEIYRRLVSAIGSEQWQGAVARQEESIWSNQFLGEYLRSEYAIAYQLDQLRVLVAKYGKLPHEVCNDPKIFPSLAFAAQILEVLEQKSSSPKQARAFVNRVKNAFNISGEMHGLQLELHAATHFVHKGRRVNWHRKKSEGSFDLLIEDLGPNGLEVECKSISENKGHRIHRRDALNFWGELWKDVSDVMQNLSTGLAVVLTIPSRLPVESIQRAALAKEVVTRILVGSGTALARGTDVRVTDFDPAKIEAAKDVGQKELRQAIDEATCTINREALVFKTPVGGILAFVIQSALDDNVLNEVFTTLSDSAAKQFSRKRGALFWVSLRGIDADQLLSLHEQDSDPRKQPTGLKLGVSNFLQGAPDHIVGVVFCSRSGLLPIVDGKKDSGGTTNFFLKKESPFWHPSFNEPL